jgi:hypothetical protein
MTRRLLSIDIDGVLADEDRHERETAEMYQRMGPEWRPRDQTGWWAERPPLQVFSEGDAELAEIVLAGWDVQIVSKRGPELESVTMSWISKHYSWLTPYISRIFFVGPHGSKVADNIPTPDLAIDDSTNAIEAYAERGVPVVAVRSGRTDYCRMARLPVPICTNLREALGLVAWQAA